MKRYFHLLMVWLTFGLAVTLLLVTVLGHVADFQALDGPTLDRWITVWVLGWLAFGLLLAAMSFFLVGRDFHSHFVEYFSRTLNALLMVIVLGCLLGLGFEIMREYSEIGLATLLHRGLGPVWAATSAVVAAVGLPTGIGEASLAPVYLGGVVLFGRAGVNWGARALTIGRAVRRAVSAPRPAGEETDAEQEARRQAAARKVAVSMYGEAKALLTKTEVHLTFLSLDVVGSTAMKQGEDPYVIEQAFSDYRAVVERMLRRHGAYKQTWTPDGQMAAFRESQAAIDCARDILLALPEFNREVSRMGSDFRLRIGANAGVVSTDDQTPMEQISDFTIDVAGHMQKYAEPDTVWMSEEVYTRLTDQTGVEPNGEEVDGRKVYVWTRPD